MQINNFKAHADLENKTQFKERIFIGTKNIYSPDNFVDFLQINFHGEIAHNSPRLIQKIVLTGVMVSQGKVCKFERGYLPEQLEHNIERHQKIDYTELHSGINALSALVQKDLLGGMINTFDPLFNDTSFVSWWNSHADDNEVIKPEEVTVEDKTAVITTAHAGKIVHDLMIETLEKYCEEYLESHLKKVSFEKSLCACES